MENIVLQDERKEQIKIVDFGLSNIYASDNPLRTHCGSPEYAAPELFVVGKRYGPEVDLWSLGVVLYGMITGRLPFMCPRDEWTSSEKRRRRLMVQINKGLTSTQERAMCQTSAECKNLINRLLMPIAHERITIREILDHPWILAPSKRNFHARSEKDLNASDHIAIMNEIATAMRTTAATVEAEIIRRKYGEIGGMYNIKIHKLHQTAAAVAACELAPRLLRGSTRQTENASSTSVTIRATERGNFRNGTSKESYNADRVVVMRHGQVQDRSVKKSSLHGSTTWNWRCRSGNGNHSSEERRNSRNRCDLSTVNASLSPQQYRVPQIIKIQGNKILEERLHRDKTQLKNVMSRTDSKKPARSGGFSRILQVDRNMKLLTLRTNSRISSESMPASQIREVHKKILNAPSWQFRVGSAKIRRDT